MAIDGVIILDRTGRPIVQTAFRGTAATYALQHIDALNNAYDTKPAEAVDPVLFVDSSKGPSACCHIPHGDVRIACPTSNEVDPLFVFAFLQTLLDVLRDYLGEVTAGSIRDSFDTVYQLLEEMLDNGQPVTTELNALRDIVTPPSFLNKVLSLTAAAGIGRATVAPFSSPIPWRSSGLRYNNNEIFFDFEEELDAIVSSTGQVLCSQVWGKIKCNSRLSGTPDVMLTLTNPQHLLDGSFHPCVRLPQWTRDRSLSFVPPDGNFVLMEYRMGTSTGDVHQGMAPPFTVKTSSELSDHQGTFDIAFSPRLPTSSQHMENVRIEVPLGVGATGASCIASGTDASWTFDSRARTISWTIKTASASSTFSLRGSFNTPNDSPKIGRAIAVSFTIPNSTFSSTKVQDLKLSRETYKPFRGAKSRSVGKIEVRW